MVQSPNFPECDRTLIQSLANYSDHDLVEAFQQHPEQGRFFTAIFCRYSHVIYDLIAQELEAIAPTTPQQTNIVFAQTWREIYRQLPQISLDEQLSLDESPSHPENFLANWLTTQTRQGLAQGNLLSSQSSETSVQPVSPPLQCYMEQALEHLPLLLRFTVVMQEYFGWSQSRIAAFLQAEGENVNVNQVQETLQQGHQALEAALPPDIRALYVDGDNHSFSAVVS